MKQEIVKEVKEQSIYQLMNQLWRKENMKKNNKMPLLRKC